MAYQCGRCASLDGDADRLVYFTQQNGCFQLFDGDRIAVLAALLVREILDELPLSAESAKVEFYVQACICCCWLSTASSFMYAAPHVDTV